ncbi:MAG TPA: HlyD family efflux transporter periplasmic adaptor subunit [Vicinamibacterales bacterium]|nr:HlyD family efflux transporter periplasmic adaptor subunit [Vicinamibacterales bacterium]
MDREIFREEAIKSRQTSGVKGEVLTLVPTWMGWTYRLMLAVLVFGAVAAVFATNHEYVEGPAVIRAVRRTTLTTTSPGVVESVSAQSGQAVARGERLVSFRADDEGAQARSLQQQIEAGLQRLLVNPLDEGTRSSLPRLQTELDLMRARASERQLRAEVDGTVGDVRVRVGQSVAPGEFILSISDPDTPFVAVAMLPAQHRPRIQVGDVLQLELRGMPTTSAEAPITGIDENIIGPSEVGRVLGRDLADSLTITGAVVIVRATLPSQYWTVSDQPFRYYDGMPATGRVRVRSQRLVSALIPGLSDRTAAPAPR